MLLFFLKYLETQLFISDSLGQLIYMANVKVTVPLIENLIVKDRSHGYEK